MARKTKEDAELTRTALLEAAEQVFFAKGVARSTLDDIASAAGMTRGAVYWHFDNKDDLLQALFDQATLPMEAITAELDKCSDADPLGALRQMFVNSLILLARSEQQQRVFSIMYLKRENIEDSISGLSQREQECGDECETRMQRIFQKAIQMKQLPADTNAFLSQQILKNFFVGTVREWLQNPKAYSLEATAPAMIDAIMAGLKSCPPR